MPFCAAPFCSNRSPRDSKRGISFHRLPLSKSKIAKKWLVKLGRDEKFLPKRAQIFVCSEHFTDDCFEVDHRHSLLGGATHKRKKKPDAVPTIFKKSYSVTHVKRNASERRHKNKERREVSPFVYMYLNYFIWSASTFKPFSSSSLLLVKSGII